MSRSFCRFCSWDRLAAFWPLSKRFLCSSACWCISSAGEAEFFGGQGGAVALQRRHQVKGEVLQVHDLPQLSGDRVQDQAQQGQALVELGGLGPLFDLGAGLARQDAVHLVVASVLVE